MSGITVSYLQSVLDRLPGDAGVIVEDSWGQKYDLVRAFAIGTKTKGPSLVLRVKSIS